MFRGGVITISRFDGYHGNYEIMVSKIEKLTMITARSYRLLSNHNSGIVV